MLRNGRSSKDRDRNGLAEGDTCRSWVTTGCVHIRLMVHACPASHLLAGVRSISVHKGRCDGYTRRTVIKITYCGESAVSGQRGGYWGSCAVRGCCRNPARGGQFSGSCLPHTVPAIGDQATAMPPYRGQTRERGCMWIGFVLGARGSARAGRAVTGRAAGLHRAAPHDRREPERRRH